LLEVITKWVTASRRYVHSGHRLKKNLFFYLIDSILEPLVV
jgi:hypothetical protein